MPSNERPADSTADTLVPVVRLRPMPPSAAGAPPEVGIGERLKYARSELSLSVEALARLTKRYDQADSKGVSPTSLLRYESGESLPGARELRLLCQAVAVPPQWLLFGELPNSGKSIAQQKLIEAMAEFVREVQSDINYGGMTVSESLEHFARAQRAEWLADAKKPGAT